MKIIAHQLGKRFEREWIFRNFSAEFSSGNTYAILGPNGSGKSTLMQVLWGQMIPSRGSVSYQINEKPIAISEVFQYVSIATPYMDLIDEFTLKEMVEFHFRHKSVRMALNATQIMEAMNLSSSKDKPIRDFSSGMRQRLKLGLLFNTKSSMYFLDEPTTNLDSQAKDWYWQQLTKLPHEALIIIASNQVEEYPSSAIKIDILRFK
ncbi:MAG: ATP-binding cassette domain-containing protein [Chryseotalea sp. WA131a]|nr:MAG: ATP-binding cassette domain-containing protein [Chryseotalea sp. WA131a]